ncbi:hypothetical protein DL89DRAFT_158616 [Linderina pennispora]|uniref:Protein kinase domain-containing protein n=1 Tax=Linderina pennispora TaxID=61395 RepID=A0A1Y1VTZ7_9FUNG|nr:uncharacterized protein DL89DRAFT_158616 [Linderina pennispora]ORX64769.1 hypothetical protein DL89DRAFT_158616 [Linderina pennispora]
MASYTAESSLDSRWCSDDGDDDDETDTEADMWVKTRLIRDADAVLDIAKPRSAAGRVLASNISKHISAELEHRLNTASTYAIADTSKTQSALEAPMQNNSYRQLLFSDTASAMSKDERSAATANVFAGFQEWIAPESIQHQPIGAPSTPPDNTCGDNMDDAKQIHTSVQSFIYFVAQQIDSFISALGADALGEHRTYRRLLPCMNQECHPSNTGNAPTIEAGITTQHRDSSIELLNNFCYADAFAVIEARPGKTRRIVDKAYAQLMKSTRSIYKAQFDRRFAFGLTVCDNEVRVCLFSNDVVFSSSALDMSTGIWSPTIHRAASLLVSLPMTTSWDSTQQSTGTRITTAGPSSVLTQQTSHHALQPQKRTTLTRCYQEQTAFSVGTRGAFLVTDERPSGDEIKPKFSLKDTWPEATEDPTRDRRDEVMFMRRITEELANSDVEDLVYPKLEAGGRVSIDTDGGRFEDNTKNALGPLYSLRKPDNAAIPFRVHKRLVMSPIGEPLETVESVHELIVVLGDAMRCHSEVLRRCNILHRDISDNNILVVREEGKQPRGLLIDFDCAVDVSEHQAPNPENVGTFPYRSINNLFGSNVERTELDDWESLFYLLCHCATVGIGERYRRSPEEMKKLSIITWHIWDSETAGDVKKSRLCCVQDFEQRIVRRFNQAQPDIEYLQRLARGLYMGLFDNRALKNPRYWGRSREVLEECPNQVSPPRSG